MEHGFKRHTADADIKEKKETCCFVDHYMYIFMYQLNF